MEEGRRYKNSICRSHRVRPIHQFT